MDGVSLSPDAETTESDQERVNILKRKAAEKYGSFFKCVKRKTREWCKDKGHRESVQRGLYRVLCFELMVPYRSRHINLANQILMDLNIDPVWYWSGEDPENKLEV